MTPRGNISRAHKRHILCPEHLSEFERSKDAPYLVPIVEIRNV